MYMTIYHFLASKASTDYIALLYLDAIPFLLEQPLFAFLLAKTTLSHRYQVCFGGVACPPIDRIVYSPILLPLYGTWLQTHNWHRSTPAHFHQLCLNTGEDALMAVCSRHLLCRGNSQHIPQHTYIAHSVQIDHTLAKLIIISNL